MGSVQGLRGHGAAGDPVSDDEQIRRYLRSVRTGLRLPKDERSRAIDEIEGHLDDAVTTRMDRGADRAQAIAMAINELGPAEVVAARFNDVEQAVATRTGIVRWAPMAVPMLQLTLAAGLLLGSLRWLPGGMTRGEQVVQRGYLQSALLAAGLSFAAYFAIRRASTDLVWRWAAWSCTGVALLIPLSDWLR